MRPSVARGVVEKKGAGGVRKEEGRGTGGVKSCAVRGSGQGGKGGQQGPRVRGDEQGSRNFGDRGRRATAGGVKKADYRGWGCKHAPNVIKKRRGAE